MVQNAYATHVDLGCLQGKYQLNNMAVLTLSEELCTLHNLEM